MTDAFAVARAYAAPQAGFYFAALAGGNAFVAFLARQASEQYFTASQFLAQLFRQVISRPQATQVLLGKAALLPLKPDLDGIN